MTRDVHEQILLRHGFKPHRFLMVGNSLGSDVLLVVEAGGRAIHVPAGLSWSNEDADMPPDAAGRYGEIAGLDELLRVMDSIGAPLPWRRRSQSSTRREAFLHSRLAG